MTWDPSKHPRQPAGSKQGGQFMPASEHIGAVDLYAPDQESRALAVSFDSEVAAVAHRNAVKAEIRRRGIEALFDVQMGDSKTVTVSAKPRADLHYVSAATTAAQNAALARMAGGTSAPSLAPKAAPRMPSDKGLSTYAARLKASIPPQELTGGGYGVPASLRTGRGSTKASVSPEYLNHLKRTRGFD